MMMMFLMAVVEKLVWAPAPFQSPFNTTTIKIQVVKHWKNTAQSDQSRILVADLSLMNRREIKSRIALKIWTSVPGEEKYQIGAVGQILETIHLIPFRNDSFMRGQSNIYIYLYVCLYIYVFREPIFMLKDIY